MVDDSIVRGTTTRGLVALVRAAGAREVHMRVSSAPVTGPCYYGIDTPSREELIAANNTLEEIRASLGVDSLGYLSLDGMLESVPGGPTRLLPCLLLGRLSHRSANRSGQAAIRLRMLTAREVQADGHRPF